MQCLREHQVIYGSYLFHLAIVIFTQVGFHILWKNRILKWTHTQRYLLSPPRPLIQTKLQKLIIYKLHGVKVINMTVHIYIINTDAELSYLLVISHVKVCK